MLHSKHPGFGVLDEGHSVAEGLHVRAVEGLLCGGTLWLAVLIQVL